MKEKNESLEENVDQVIFEPHVYWSIERQSRTAIPTEDKNTKLSILIKNDARFKIKDIPELIGGETQTTPWNGRLKPGNFRRKLKFIAELLDTPIQHANEYFHFKEEIPGNVRAIGTTIDPDDGSQVLNIERIEIVVVTETNQNVALDENNSNKKDNGGVIVHTEDGDDKPSI
ncbi:MAG: hypothetical protein ACPGJS_12330 [Flammeovirgaceae bacterium]